MNIKQEPSGNNLTPKTHSLFNVLANKMRKIHHSLGETDTCINSIQNEIVSFLPKNINGNDLVQKLINPVQQKACQNIQHLVYRIIHTNDLKVALHITTAGITIPIHSHPGDINALFVVEGGINLHQYSFIKNYQPEVRHFYLEKNSCNVGLQYFYNTHELETTEPLTAFFSIRCKTQAQKQSFFQRFKIPGRQGLAQI